MPELPEVETFKKYIDASSLDQKIIGIDCADHRLLKKEQEQFESNLVGHRFTETYRIGKYLFLKTTGSKILVMHFGMTGRPAYYYGAEARPKYAHIVYRFSNGYNLGFQNRRKFGWNDLTDNIEEYQKQIGLSTDARELTFEAFKNRTTETEDLRKTGIDGSVCDRRDRKLDGGRNLLSGPDSSLRKR